MYVSVSEAAEYLGVSRQRVHALIASGRLEAERIGGRYAIRKSDLARPRQRRAGRPLSAAMAGGLLRLVAGESPPDLDPAERHRLRRKAAALANADDTASLLRQWLPRRADRQLYSAATADLAGLREDPRLMLSGMSHPSAHISAADLIEGYVEVGDLEALVDDHLLVHADDANVILHVAEVVPPLSELLIAADLADHRSPRGDRQARALASRWAEGFNSEVVRG